ncbi:WD repeat-containing protein 35 isoform X4 [Agrilus planipennis]|uniref:WD repeat-containing protein 35 isoform X4 n=1 Tax=Agrilus planipennis TaxID=224129 RepID=A0A1W4XDR5_AGRPL|nr:WD repeat-containing protein 35 isoform X4 [Agrilus planipennis]
MFIYLSKKIAIPNNARINCLAWNKEDGYLAVGGEEGLLKVLKLDSGGKSESDDKPKGLAASSNLSMNQTLDGHSEDVRVIMWNELHRKLTSSDESGIIIVWLMYKGTWYEEMINNRKKSTVVGMDWSSDGLKICIVYEDGAVIVGSVDGNRIWGKELKGIHLSGVQWSPDDDNINTYQNGKLERKDVWAMCWASDNPQLLSVMEKTRMYIFKGVHPEEPIACAGYICSFNDLEIQAVLLDEIIEAPEKPNGNHIIKLEVKSLRDTRQLLEKVGITETIQFIEDNPHPRLWKLLGEAALKDLNLTTAESAFVRSRNYSGIQLVKKLQTINGNAIKKAYVEAYLENFEEAERLFIEADRRDLALSLRQTLGDWFRVIQIMKNGVTAPDLLLETAYNSAADYFVHNNNWAAAAEYYELSKNISGLIECHFHLENLDALEKLIDKLPEKDALLKRLSDIFASNAVIGPAVKCLLKIGDAKSAVDLCISHNNWDQAIHLATQYRLPEIANIFKTYSAHLVDQNQLLKAVEVNKQTNFYFTAAVHATKLAQNEINKSNRNLLDIKKLFVYSALLMELSKTKSAEEEVLNSDSDMLLVDSAWRGAEAYHLLILIHEHLYANKIHNATITAFKLQEYCDIIPPQEVYSILALVSCLDNEFGLCSNAFTKLQTLPNITKAEKEAYDKLAVDIFTAQDPVDLKTYTLKCYNCEVPVIDWCTSCSNCNANFPSCMVSGCPLINNVEDKWSCNVCHHVAKSVYANFRKSCPLCHTSIERNSSNYK